MQAGPQLTVQTNDRWRNRQSRLADLRAAHAAAAAILDFYVALLQFQSDVASAADPRFKPGAAFQDQVDLNLALDRLPALIEMTIQRGPELLAGKALLLRDAGQSERRALLQAAMSPATRDEVSDFFARACLQPIAENLQLQVTDDANYSGCVCPVCSSRPQMSIRRPEGEGARRSLLCSLCLREWVFRRVVCPACGEEDKEKLPQYSADAFQQVRIEGCDSCKRYLKTVDLTVDGHAVPLVDEVAAAVLDVWATEHGYTKIAKNLMGF